MKIIFLLSFLLASCAKEPPITTPTPTLSISFDGYSNTLKGVVNVYENRKDYIFKDESFEITIILDINGNWYIEPSGVYNNTGFLITSSEGKLWMKLCGNPKPVPIQTFEFQP